MAAITIRNLPDDVHSRLRDAAASRGISVEGFVRTSLAQTVAPAEAAASDRVTGFADAFAPWPAQPLASGPAAPELWGALKGSVHVPDGVALEAGLDEAWLSDS